MNKIASKLFVILLFLVGSQLFIANFAAAQDMSDKTSLQEQRKLQNKVEDRAQKKITISEKEQEPSSPKNPITLPSQEDLIEKIISKQEQTTKNDQEKSVNLKENDNQDKSNAGIPWSNTMTAVAAIISAWAATMMLILGRQNKKMAQEMHKENQAAAKSSSKDREEMEKRLHGENTKILQAELKPIISFGYACDNSQHWKIENIGKGPALNVLVAHERDNEIEKPIRNYGNIASNEDFYIPWELEPNVFFAKYNDIYGKNFVVKYDKTAGTLEEEVVGIDEFPEWCDQKPKLFWKMVSDGEIYPFKIDKPINTESNNESIEVSGSGAMPDRVIILMTSLHGKYLAVQKKKDNTSVIADNEGRWWHDNCKLVNKGENKPRLLYALAIQKNVEKKVIALCKKHGENPVKNSIFDFKKLLKKEGIAFQATVGNPLLRR